MPKRLLRSTIDFGEQVAQDALAANYQRLLNSPFEWARPVDQRLFTFLGEFYQHHHQAPSVRVVIDRFEELEDIEAQERIKDVQAAESYTYQNFAYLLRSLIEEQNKIKAAQLVKETQEVINRGLTVGEGKNKKRLSGVRDAAVYFTQQIHDLIPEDYNAKTRGDVRDDTEAAWKDYEEAKLNKDKVFGCFSGIHEIDTVCHGLKKGELWLHAAFAGELKTSFALNWCYNLVTRYRRNVLYVSLEMPYKQLRRQSCVLHTANPVWRSQGKDPLDYRKVRDGELDLTEEAFYQEALADFEGNKDYCRFHIWAPDRDVTIKDIQMEAELQDRQMELGLIVIDHGGLVQPSTNDRDYTIRFNSVLREAKKLALHFNHGEGIAVLLPFQINREGKDYADKNEGRYKLRALSYANEAERSADVVTTSYLNDDHRENGTSLFCNLKNRDNPIIAPFLAGVDFTCRRVRTLNPGERPDGDGMGIDRYGDEMDALSEMTV